jgi:hypothetical protein
MALGDYTKVTYVPGDAPGISATNLNNNEDKTEELDIELAAHQADTATMHGAVSAATPSKLMIRDASGRAKVTAPSASDDIAILSNVDAVNTSIMNQKRKLRMGVRA